MAEARKSEYFVDGFLIRHFNIFPAGFNKEDLFEEQKVFLMYLVGNIPEMELWKRNIDYENKVEEIRTKDDIKLEQTEIDLANFHGKDLNEERRKKLFNEKKRLMRELREKFGFEDNEEVEEEIIVKEKEKQDPSQIWDLLQGKGLTKNG